MRARFLLLLLTFWTLCVPLASRADDFGPGNAVAQVRSDARRLLAHRVRESGADPRSVQIADVVVSGDRALLSWRSGKDGGIMGLIVQDRRWWDALDITPSVTSNCFQTVTAYPLPPGAEIDSQLVALAKAHIASYPREHINCPPSASRGTERVHSSGGVVHPDRASTAYDLKISYARNDAQPAAVFDRVYMRAPTSAEFLPNPVPPKNWGGPTDIGYFDIDVSGAKPIAFLAGTTVDVWSPFVLDDTLRYDLSFVSNDKAYGPIRGRLFDNVLHFQLPAFVIVPGNQLEAELSGWY